VRGETSNLRPREAATRLLCSTLLVGAAVLLAGCGDDGQERSQASLDLQLSEIAAATMLETTPPVETGGQRISDSDGAISFQGAPNWDDQAEREVTDEGRIIGSTLTASTDRERLRTTFAEPGVFVFASRVYAQWVAIQPDAGLAMQGIFQAQAPDVSSACGVEVFDFVIEPDGDDAFSQLLGDIAQTGLLSLYPNCDEEEADFLSFGLLTQEGTYVYGEGTAPTANDFAEVSRALGTLEIKGDLLPAGTPVPSGTTGTETETEPTETETEPSSG
jgi:hypothetical protein